MQATIADAPALLYPDKEIQLALLDGNMALKWMGVLPLQMTLEPRKEAYQIKYNALSTLTWR